MKKIIGIVCAFILGFANVVYAGGEAPLVTKNERIGATFAANQYVGNDEVSIKGYFTYDVYKVRGAEKSDLESSFLSLRAIGFDQSAGFAMTFYAKFREYLTLDYGVDMNLKTAWWVATSCTDDQVTGEEICIDLKVVWAPTTDVETYHYGTAEQGCYVFTSHGLLQMRRAINEGEVSVEYSLTRNGQPLHEGTPSHVTASVEKGPYLVKERDTLACM